MSLSDAALGRLRDTLELPDAGPRYVLGDRLGRGGMGVVFAAHDRELDRDVALKVLAVEAGSPADVERLQHEAILLAQLDHPGIVAVHDRGSLSDGRPFYVMRLVRGKRLDVHASQASRGDLLRLFLQLADAVAFAHARGIIHRDLKPGNVMVGEFGEAFVLDWGIARREMAPGTPEVAGTPGFMAPEQAAGAGGDARVDIHGLGAVLRDLLARQPVPVPRPLAAIVTRATAFDPAARYASVADLADDVRRFQDGEPVRAYQENLLERAGRLYRRHQLLILLLLAYAIVRVTILMWRGI